MTNKLLSISVQFLKLSLAALFLCSVGCQKSNGTTARKINYVVHGMDHSRLYWCIDRIQSGDIHRGMHTNSLGRIFGESLEYHHKGKLAALLSVPTDKISSGSQWPPMWQINFVIDQEGFVTDYSLIKGDK